MPHKMYSFIVKPERQRFITRAVDVFIKRIDFPNK